MNLFGLEVLTPTELDECEEIVDGDLIQEDIVSRLEKLQQEQLNGKASDSE